MNGHEHIKHAIDGISGITAFVAVMGVLPTLLASIASALAIVWYVIRITEYFLSKKTGKAKFID